MSSEEVYAYIRNRGALYGTASAIEETIEEFIDAGCGGFMVFCNSAPSAEALEQLAALPSVHYAIGGSRHGGVAEAGGWPPLHLACGAVEGATPGVMPGDAGSCTAPLPAGGGSGRADGFRIGVLPWVSMQKESIPEGASSMTTVNVRIERLDSGDRLYLQNGMWGPATSVLHSFSRACRDGRIPSSKWNVAEINEVTTGAVVRQALDAIKDWDWQQSRDSTDQERVAAFRDRLLDNAEYEIHALEV